MASERAIRTQKNVVSHPQIQLKGHSGTIVGLKFSPDDKQLVTVGADGIVLVWNLYA